MSPGGKSELIREALSSMVDEVILHNFRPSHFVSYLERNLKPEVLDELAAEEAERRAEWEGGDR